MHMYKKVFDKFGDWHLWLKTTYPFHIKKPIFTPHCPQTSDFNCEKNQELFIFM